MTTTNFTEKVFKFTEGLVCNFEKNDNKLTLLSVHNDKIVVLSGAMALFFNDLEKEPGEVSFQSLLSDFIKTYPDYDEEEIKTLLQDIIQKLVETEILTDD